jgi:hypothetical protein
MAWPLSGPCELYIIFFFITPPKPKFAKTDTFSVIYQIELCLNLADTAVFCFADYSRMTNCNLSKVADNTFQGLYSLEGLWVKSFPNEKDLVLFQVAKVCMLLHRDLAYNNLIKLTDMVFSGLRDLRYMWVWQFSRTLELNAVCQNTENPKTIIFFLDGWWFSWGWLLLALVQWLCGLAGICN